MPKTLTKTDIEFDQFNISRAKVGGDVKYIISLTYIVLTQEGESINKSFDKELSPGQINKISKFFDEVEIQIKKKEDII